MKYKRKPVDRSVVDAIFDAQTESYHVALGDGSVVNYSKEQFEAAFEAVQRVRAVKAPKPRKPRKARAAAEQPAAPLPS